MNPKNQYNTTMGIDPPEGNSDNNHQRDAAAAAAASAMNGFNDSVLPDGLLPEVAAALGISVDNSHDQDSKMTVDARNAMADVSLYSHHHHEGAHGSSSHSPNRSADADAATHATKTDHRYGGHDERTDFSYLPAPRPPPPPPPAAQLNDPPLVLQAEPRLQSAAAAPAPLLASRPPSVRATPLHATTPAAVHVNQVYPMQTPMAQAVPVPASDQPDQSTSGVLYHRTKPLEKHQIAQLRALGYSEGLIDGLNELKECMPLRFWLVDNSGSMLQNDGLELRGHGGQAQPFIVECTRWVELQGTVEWHASLAGVLGTHTVFRLLNAPEHMVPAVHEFVVADPSNPTQSARESVARAKDVMTKVVPKGFTPLSEHLQRISDSIKSIEHTLRSRSQQAVIVIATDGTPTDSLGDSTESAREEFRRMLKAMQNLPLWVVIRLCTDDPEVMSYYNSLDQQV